MTDSVRPGAHVRRLGSWALLAAVGVIVVLVAILVIRHEPGSGYPKPRPQRAFDAAIWKELGAADELVKNDGRGRMIDSLLGEHLRLGMSREEVEKLLGKPDHSRWSEVFPHPGYFIANGDGFTYSDPTGMMLVYDEHETLVGWWTPWNRKGAVARAQR